MHSPLHAADLPVGRDAWDDDRARERMKKKNMRARIAVRIARGPRVLHPKTRPTLFLTTPVRICPPRPPMPMFQPEDARLFAHFCLASRSLQNADVDRPSVTGQPCGASYDERMRYARVGEANAVRDVEHERQDDDGHEADSGQRGSAHVHAQTAGRRRSRCSGDSGERTTG